MVCLQQCGAWAVRAAQLRQVTPVREWLPYPVCGCGPRAHPAIVEQDMLLLACKPWDRLSNACGTCTGAGKPAWHKLLRKWLADADRVTGNGMSTHVQHPVPWCG